MRGLPDSRNIPARLAPSVRRGIPSRLRGPMTRILAAVTLATLVLSVRPAMAEDGTGPDAPNVDRMSDMTSGLMCRNYIERDTIDVRIPTAVRGEDGSQIGTVEIDDVGHTIIRKAMG